MIKNIDISVIMSVYNGEKDLKQAITSILSQTFRNFEFIIINDGSQDKSDHIIRSFTDHRIRYYNNTKNIGLASSLNKGIKYAKGKYIARMDADDISLPNRFRKQYEFMENNPDIGLLGSSYACIDDNGKLLQAVPALINNDDLTIAMTYQCPFGHGTIMIRKEILTKNKLLYPTDKRYLEDYRLWSEVIQITKVHNLADILYLHRINQSSLTNTYLPKIIVENSKIGKRIVSTIHLSRFDPVRDLLRGKEYREKDHLKFKNLNINYSLEYQNCLFHKAFIYLKRGAVLPFMVILIISFLIKPGNYFMRIKEGVLKR